MNELWYENFKSILTQMNNVADKIQETVSKCDEATRILVGNKAFEYYDETTNICDGIPIHPEPITINLKESTSFGEDTIDEATTSTDGKNLYRFRLALWYTFYAMDSPKLPDDETAQFWVTIRIGMDEMQVSKEIEFEFEAFSIYLDHLLNDRYPNVPSWNRSDYTVDDFKAVIADLFDNEENINAFNEWIDTIMKIVDEFELSNDGGESNGNS